MRLGVLAMTVGMGIFALTFPSVVIAQQPARVLLESARLSDADPLVRWQAATELRRMGAVAKSAVPLLCKVMLADEDEKVRTAVTYALVAIVPEGKEAVDALQQAVLHDPSSRIRTHAVDALGAMGANAEPAIPALLHALRSDEEKTVRIAAVITLSRIGKASVAPLQESLADKDPVVRRGAAFALGELGDEAKPAAAKLIDLLINEAEPEDVRIAAFVSLAKIKPGPEQSQRAVPTLIKVLSEGKVPSNRLQAAWALGQIGPVAKDALPALEKAASEEDATLKQIAAESIQLIKGT